MWHVLSFGQFTKEALTPPLTRFWHPWGKFCLTRFTKKTHKIKISQNNLQTRRRSPVDNRPSHNLFHCIVQPKQIKNLNSCMWHMTGEGRWTFSQNFSSLALTVWEWRCSKNISTKKELLREGFQKKTEESVTTFHLGLPPPLMWPELGEIFSPFFACFYYIWQTMKHILVIFCMF